MIMDAFNLMLTLYSGITRLAIGSVFCYMAYVTWSNPHPVGRSIAPQLFGILGAYCLNDGIRAVFFYLGVSVGVTVSLLATFVLCLLLFMSVSNVERNLLAPRRRKVSAKDGV